MTRMPRGPEAICCERLGRKRIVRLRSGAIMTAPADS